MLALMWDFLGSIICVFWSGPDVGGDLTGAGVATALHVLTFLGLAAFDSGAAVSRSATTDAAENMGRGQCETAVGDFAHGCDCAHGLWEAAGSTEELRNISVEPLSPI